MEKNTMAWWAGELDRPLVWLAAGDPALTAKPFSYQSNFPLSMPAAEVVDRYEPFLAATRYYADAFPWWWVNFGPGIAAGFMGAQVNSVHDPSETVWFTPAEVKPIHELQLLYQADNIWWKRVKELTAAIVERWQGQLAASVTDLGGNLDILASFRETQRLLVEMIDEPDEVARLVGQITRLWMRYYGELDAIIRPACRGTSCWTPIWSTGKTYMLQCDFSYMISPRMFERHVVPDLTACCEYLDHGFYHLDGKGEIPHLKHLLGIERLRGIQWIPGDGQPSPDHWLPLLQQIRAGGKLCQVFVSPEGARRIVQNLGGKGFLFVIQNDRYDFYNPEIARAFLKTLAEEDIS
jgi:5-methyltetrahydrofolate--homocysteine methyltransferase